MPGFLGARGKSGRRGVVFSPTCAACARGSAPLRAGRPPGALWARSLRPPPQATPPDGQARLGSQVYTCLEDFESEDNINA